jgi:hypothetical protein
MRERNYLEDLGVGGRIIHVLYWNFRKSVGDVDWIDLAHDRGSWPALVKAIMNLPLQKMWEIS